ncbi:MAG: glutaredoxin 3 [Pseudomonadota bacterium]
MEKVVIYSTPICPYCLMAKRLLTSKGVEFEDISLYTNPDRRAEMMEKSGGRHTVPQIFIGETHIGGNDDLQALERAGKLDPLLEGQS